MGTKKLIIQVPCFNEEDSLPVALGCLPRAVEGVDQVEWLLIDDGSTDRSVEIAREHGVDHIVRLPRNQGLARGFMAGIAACLEHGADIIVNTDADNQYEAKDIPALVAPILRGEAEIVIGRRPVDSMEQYTRAKRILHRIGTWVVKKASRTQVSDAPSGFRAMSRDAAMRLNVFGGYSYTLETVIQAGQKSMAVASVPVRTNPTLRASRLIRNIPSYLKHSVVTIVRIFMIYRPFTFFAVPGLITLGLGLILGIRFAIFYFTGDGEGHVQSVILAALLVGCGGFLVVVGLLADLIAVNRQLLEKVDWRIQKLEAEVRRRK